MIQFLTTTGIAAQIETIIRSAKKEIVLVSPFLKFTTNFIQRLQTADKRGVAIHVVYGKEDLQDEAKEALRKLDNLKLYFFKHLHAKCYFNEQSMVISSMNLYEFSEKNNREMGVLVTKGEEVYHQAEMEAHSLMDHATKKSLKKPRRKDRSKSSYTRTSSRKAKKRGYCIRCRQAITHDPTKPYCNSCYEIWSRWEDPLYTEKHCHSCGSQIESSMQKPQCYSCYKAVRS